MDKSKVLCLFDVDGTLTDPRKVFKYYTINVLVNVYIMILYTINL